MQKFSNTIGVMLPGTIVEGKMINENEKRIVVIQNRESYSSEDLPGVFVSRGFRFKIAELIAFLQAQNKTHVEFLDTELVVSQESVLSQEEFADYLEHEQRRLCEAILASNVSQAEKEAGLVKVAEDVESDRLFVERGLTCQGIRNP